MPSLRFIKKENAWMLLPVLGSIAFLLLYVVAALLYPGGYAEDPKASGFSWMHNYWCNLLGEKSINGAINTARPVAITAMVVLLISLLVFWFLCAARLQLSLLKKWLIRIAAILCVAVLPFLSSMYHDEVINVAGFFGMVAMAMIYDGLYANRWYRLFTFGIFNLLLVGLNNIIYYSQGLLHYLPPIQKISFISCLLFVCLVTYKLYRQASSTSIRVAGW